MLVSQLQYTLVNILDCRVLPCNQLIFIGKMQLTHINSEAAYRESAKGKVLKGKVLKGKVLIGKVLKGKVLKGKC